MILSFENLLQLTQASFLCGTYLTHAIKVYTFVKKGSKIRATLRRFEKELYQPDTDELVESVAKMRKGNDYFYYVYGSITVLNVVYMVVAPLFRDGRILPREVQFLDNADVVTFCLTYLYQAVTITSAAVTNMTMDFVPSAIMSYICAELFILNSRLSNIGKNKLAARLEFEYCFEHHKALLEY